MSERTSVYLVCSPRPRVGKTMLARLLADFLRLDGGTVAAFDVGSPQRDLAVFLPDLTREIDLADTRGQMALFDRLVRDDGVSKVVDVSHAAFRSFLDIAGEIAAFTEMGRRGVEPIALFPTDPHPASGQAYVAFGARFPGVTLVAAHNDAFALSREERGRFAPADAAAVAIHLTQLPPGLRGYAENPKYAFRDFYEAFPIGVPAGMSVEMDAWLRRAFLEFRQLELRLLMRCVARSLAHPSAAALPATAARQH